MTGVQTCALPISLKKMPAKDRLLNLNKEKVDTFLNYTFRSLFSARNPSAKTNLIVENKWGSAREVLFDFQEMLIPNHNLVLFFPQEGELKQFYVKTPGNKVRFNKKYTENFVDLYDKDINSQSLVADIKKAQKEIDRMNKKSGLCGRSKFGIRLDAEIEGRNRVMGINNQTSPVVQSSNLREISN